MRVWRQVFPATRTRLQAKCPFQAAPLAKAAWIAAAISSVACRARGIQFAADKGMAYDIPSSGGGKPK
jgi:nitrite reductase/ring-hydroxylating ferredoxin subunit